MTPARRPMARAETVEIDGDRIAFRRQGSGPPLVLLHGGICDGRVWWQQFDALSDRFTVVAWDAPGCGGSFDPPEPFGLDDYADCLAAFIDALSLERPHVLGHSWGSGLALQLQHRHPGLPRSLVLAGAYAGWAGSLPADEVQERLQRALDVADRLPDEFDPRAVPGLFTDAMPAETQEALLEIMMDIRPVGTRMMARAFAEADLRDALGEIHTPTLLLYGEDDARSTLDVAAELQRRIPSATLTTMPGLGHEAFAEAPAVFNGHVREFLERIEPRG